MIMVTDQINVDTQPIELQYFFQPSGSGTPRMFMLLDRHVRTLIKRKAEANPSGILMLSKREQQRKCKLTSPCLQGGTSMVRRSRK